MSSAEILGEKVAGMELREEDDPYRWNMHGESEKNTVWRDGSPPSYTQVNTLFETTRTKVWPKGSLEETVQNLVKTWEMELSHKTQLKDFKTIDPHKFSLCVNGRATLSGEETLQVGSYNALMQSSLPEELQYYKTSKETFESSHEVFRTAFPGGFAWEVLEVYSGLPVMNFKFRHWGVMEGPFKGHVPTGQTVQFTGIAIAKVNEKLRMEEVEVYYDPAELCGGLLKGQLDQNYEEYKTGIEGCPFFS